MRSVLLGSRQLPVPLCRSLEREPPNSLDFFPPPSDEGVALGVFAIIL